MNASGALPRPGELQQNVKIGIFERNINADKNTQSHVAFHRIVRGDVDSY